jgi:hypothetical protein
MPQDIYSARWAGPLLIEQGKAETFTLAIERNGSGATITSGTLTIYTSGGVKVIDAAAGSVAVGVFTFPTIGATVFDDQNLGPNYLIQVDALIGGVNYRFTNDAVLCVAQLYPTVAQSDLIQRHSEAAALLGASITSLQQYIDQAWGDITTRLYIDGVEFWKWRTAAATRAALFARSFELLFFDYATLLQANDRYLKLAEHYAVAYDREFERLASKTDQTEANTIGAEINGGAPVIMLSSGARRRRR